MDRLATLIPKTLHKHGIKSEADASLIVHHATQWMTEHRAPERACVTKVKDNVIVIEVDNGIEAQECHALSDDLLHALWEIYGHSEVKRIQILRKKTSQHI